MGSKTLQNLLVVFGGRVSFVLLSVIGTSLVMRHLGTAEAGAYWLCLTAGKIVTSCLADGLDFAVLRSVPGALDTDRERALDTLRAAFALRMGTVCALAALAGAFSYPLGELLFKRTDSAHLLLLTGAAAIGEMLMRSAMGYFQAAQQFQRLVVLEMISQGLRFAAILALLRAHMLSTTSAMAAYLAPPFAAFLYGLYGMPADIVRPRLPSRAEMLRVYAYTKWIVLVMAVAAVYERLDVMLLGLLSGPSEVGLYGPAVMLATAPELAVSVVLTVLNPRVRMYHADDRSRELIALYLRWAVPIGAAAAVGAVTIGGPVILFLFGAKYAQSILLFKILAIGTLVFAMITPPYSAFLSMFAPRRTLVITATGLGMAAAGGLFVIPRFGAVGTAMMMTVIRVLLAGMVTVIAGHVLRGSGTPAVSAASAGTR